MYHDLHFRQEHEYFYKIGTIVVITNNKAILKIARYVLIWAEPAPRSMTVRSQKHKNGLGTKLPFQSNLSSKFDAFFNEFKV